MKQMTTGLSLALAATLTITSLFSVKASATKSNDELVIGLSQEFENLNPLIMTMMATNYMYALVGRTLVYMDADGKWKPQLAKSIPTLENGGAKKIKVDGKETIQAVWEIKETAKWSDGTPVTCGDFEFSIQVASSPNVSVAAKENFTQVSKVEIDKANPKKCTFTYDKLRWNFNQMGQFYPLPKHLEASVFNKWSGKKEGYETNSNYSKAPTLKGLYNGPYQISEVKLGSHVAFTTNPHFYGDSPKIKKIVIKIIPNTSTLEANLRSGTIDAISSLGLTFDQALSFEKKVKADKMPFEVQYRPSLTYEHIDLDTQNPILKDVRVRKALVHAINREDLVKALFEGRQQAAIHLFAPIDPWYSADPTKVVLYPYSRREAARLLDEAGWKLGSDGIRTKGGQRLSLPFMTTAGNKTRETVQTYLQNQWKSVGVEVVIKNEPARVFFGETTKKRAFGAMAMYAWISSPESSLKEQFACSEIPTEKNGWSGQNYTAWCNKKVDELAEKINAEFNDKKRAGLAHQFLKLYTDEVPVIPLYYRADIAVNPTSLKNLKVPGHLFAETNEAETWTF